MKRNRKLFVCTHNEGYAVSLDVRKIYQAVPDIAAEQLGMVRIIDESGEEYLYPKTYFASISLSPSVRHELMLAA